MFSYAYRFTRTHLYACVLLFAALFALSKDRYASLFVPFLACHFFFNPPLIYPPQLLVNGLHDSMYYAGMFSDAAFTDAFCFLTTCVM